MYKWQLDIGLDLKNSLSTELDTGDSGESGDSDDSGDSGESVPLATSTTSTTMPTVIEEVNIIDRDASRREQEDNQLDYDEEDLIELNPEVDSGRPEEDSQELVIRSILIQLNIESMFRIS